MSDTLRIIPLGGLGEVGKNMTLYEFDGQRILIDAGLAFPRDEHLGVDLVLPDFSYLEDRPLLAIVLTHGHEDHVGALPYVLREVEVGEVIATKLTLAMVKSKLDEHKLGASTTLREADPDGDGIQIGPFKLEFVRMAHSIPDCVAIVIETPAGRVLHTGDWKLDHTPVDGLKTDVGKLASMGNRGVDLMLGDSTNAERPGMTGSERLVGEAFRQLIPMRTGRILVASFASNIHRMQQAAEVAIANDRKVALVGRSMRKNMNIARNLGYVDLPEDALVSPKEAMDLPPNEVMILCTGSQGEPMSALTRIAYGDHQNVDVERGDTVIISAKPVPGNELRVHDSINRLSRLGRGGAPRGDRDGARLRPRLLGGAAHAALARPPEGADADPRRVPHARRAREARPRRRDPGVRDRDRRERLRRRADAARASKIVDRIAAGVTFVDGLGVGDVQDVALRDRRRLSEDGVLIVVTTVALSDGGEIAPPELIARGFGDNEELLDELRDEADRIADELAEDGITEIKLLQEHMHDAIAKLVYDRTRRRPMILPVVIEV